MLELLKKYESQCEFSLVLKIFSDGTGVLEDFYDDLIFDFNSKEDLISKLKKAIKL